MVVVVIMIQIIGTSPILKQLCEICSLFSPLRRNDGDGVWLDDDRTLNSYRIGDGDIIQLRLRIHAGYAYV